MTATPKRETSATDTEYADAIEAQARKRAVEVVPSRETRPAYKPGEIESALIRARNNDACGNWSAAADGWEKVIRLAVAQLNWNLREIGQRDVVSIVREVPVSAAVGGR